MCERERLFISGLLKDLKEYVSILFYHQLIFYLHTDERFLENYFENNDLDQPSFVHTKTRKPGHRFHKAAWKLLSSPW